jgi:hypothetical protein
MALIGSAISTGSGSWNQIIRVEISLRLGAGSWVGDELHRFSLTKAGQRCPGLNPWRVTLAGL